MKAVVTIFALALTTSALAQHADHAAPAPAPAPPAAPAAVATKFNLDTPIEQLVADPRAKAVLDADLGIDITALPTYASFKAYSLKLVAVYAPDKLPSTTLDKLGVDLAAIK